MVTQHMNSRIDWYSLLAPSFHFILCLSFSYWPSLSVRRRRLICIPLSALNDSLPLCIHLTRWSSVYFVCVFMCECVGSKCGHTYYSLLIFRGRGRCYRRHVFIWLRFPKRDCNWSHIYTLIIDTHVHVCAPYNLVCLPDQQDRWTGDVRFSF